MGKGWGGRTDAVEGVGCVEDVPAERFGGFVSTGIDRLRVAGRVSGVQDDTGRVE